MRKKLLKFAQLAQLGQPEPGLCHHFAQETSAFRPGWDATKQLLALVARKAEPSFALVAFPMRPYKPPVDNHSHLPVALLCNGDRLCLVLILCEFEY